MTGCLYCYDRWQTGSVEALSEWSLVTDSTEETAFGTYPIATASVTKLFPRYFSKPELGVRLEACSLSNVNF